MFSQSLFTLLAAGTIFALSCGKSDTPAAAKPATAAAATDEFSVVATKDLMDLVTIGKPPVSTLAGSLEVSARIEANETRMARVSAPVAGRITELNIVEGQNIKSGDVIALITSTQLSEAQANFLRAQLNRRQAERAVDRAKRLLEADVIGSAELLRREAELTQAISDLNAARDQLSLLGMPDSALGELERTRSVRSISHVKATLDGTVLERPVTPGQVVQAAETIGVLADLSTVWLVADVPEQAAGGITVGKSVEAEIPALPGLKLNGKLSFVSSTVNRDTRTVRIRMDVPNPNGRLKPAMLATVNVKDLPETHRVVPLGAIVRENNEDCVFVYWGKNKFRLRPVQLKPGSEKEKILVDGLAPGEEIALSGAFHLNNERKRQAIGGTD
ncbi:MAG: efflux RND transporter periplasmic adaptor subunit [Bryobacter sp.]|nr:efflux RND transporter periplasmic adaptor subunit [Bryobacter sp.]